MSTQTELRKCPFCGGEPYLHEPDFRGDNYQIGCRCGDDDDEGAVWRNGRSLEEVTERWNRAAALTDRASDQIRPDTAGYPPGTKFFAARCGWCGAYEGTVNTAEPCARDSTTGEYIGPHQFGVYETVPAVAVPADTPRAEPTQPLREALLEARDSANAAANMPMLGGISPSYYTGKAKGLETAIVLLDVTLAALAARPADDRDWDAIAAKLEEHTVELLTARPAVLQPPAFTIVPEHCGAACRAAREHIPDDGQCLVNAPVYAPVAAIAFRERQPIGWAPLFRDGTLVITGPMDRIAAYVSKDDAVARAQREAGHDRVAPIFVGAER